VSEGKRETKRKRESERVQIFKCGNFRRRDKDPAQRVVMELCIRDKVGSRVELGVNHAQMAKKIGVGA